MAAKKSKSNKQEIENNKVEPDEPLFDTEGYAAVAEDIALIQLLVRSGYNMLAAATTLGIQYAADFKNTPWVLEAANQRCLDFIDTSNQWQIATWDFDMLLSMLGQVAAVGGTLSVMATYLARTHGDEAVDDIIEEFADAVSTANNIVLTLIENFEFEDDTEDEPEFNNEEE